MSNIKQIGGIDRIKELLSKGLTIQQVSARLGYSEKYVRDIRKKMEIND